jgi:hypothetical protein
MHKKSSEKGRREERGEREREGEWKGEREKGREEGVEKEEAENKGKSKRLLNLQISGFFFPPSLVPARPFAGQLKPCPYIYAIF